MFSQLNPLSCTARTGAWGFHTKCPCILLISSTTSTYLLSLSPRQSPQKRLKYTVPTFSPSSALIAISTANSTLSHRSKNLVTPTVTVANIPHVILASGFTQNRNGPPTIWDFSEYPTSRPISSLESTPCSLVMRLRALSTSLRVGLGSRGAP